MHDWNHDGRINAQDSFFDYQVFNEVMGNKKESKSKPAPTPAPKPKTELKEPNPLSVFLWVIVSGIVIIFFLTH